MNIVEAAMATKIIACEVMKEELLANQGDQEIEFQFVEMALHEHPEKLHAKLQEILDQSPAYERIILAFGLCGGAINKLHSSKSILTIPRVHDCIPIFLGSRALYDTLQKNDAGTFYLTCGMVNGEKSLMAEYERVSTKYGEERARRIYATMFDNYHRILFIRTGAPDEESDLKKSLATAELLNLQHQTLQGRKYYLHKLIHGPWDGDDFVNTLPNEPVSENIFIFPSAQDEIK
jgi:hypothetical protein